MLIPGDEIVDKYVMPFHSLMAGTPGTNWIQPVREPLIIAAKDISKGDVLQLLREPWRSRVMGGWFAARYLDDAEVRAELLQSLRTSRGLLTSPCLAVSAFASGDPEAIDALNAYLMEHETHNWGNPGFFAALLTHFDHEAPISFTERDSQLVVEMLEIVDLIQKA